ncbi:ferritin-like catalase Nec2 [Malania oleifera]|uniref:ferritin-like catalase Nec2 n=1 Tax=Malania oleifera TaxID=397392 RepID=UPI0025AE9D91|nr:ferritin-like catalase Nec2 [Malania oleifera]
MAAKIVSGTTAAGRTSTTLCSLVIIAILISSLVPQSYSVLLPKLPPPPSGHSSTPTICSPPPSPGAAYGPIPVVDIDTIEFPLNVEFLETELFMVGATGKGLDDVAPELAQGGPAPIPPDMANLDPEFAELFEEFAWQEVDHLRPQTNLSAAVFAEIMNQAFCYPLNPPFNPFANNVNFLIASYFIPYVGGTGYVGGNVNLQGPASRRLVGGLMAVEWSQDAIIRELLNQRKNTVVKPYNYTVADFTVKMSELRNRLGGAGDKDEGLVVPKEQGAGGQVTSNVVSANNVSIAYDRSAAEVLRILYLTGKENRPGGLLTYGGNGNIAQGFLKKKSA